MSQHNVQSCVSAVEFSVTSVFVGLVAALLGAEAAVGAAFPTPVAPWAVVAVGPPAGGGQDVFRPFFHTFPFCARNLAGRYRCWAGPLRRVLSGKHLCHVSHCTT